ncbi:hypothetical protein TgHK011_001824 [Trichoderma gracile]|nr:hypothetical protein TgHK011_001824 [Trichoderma gracile]
MEANPEPKLLPVVKPRQRKIGTYVIPILRRRLHALRSNDITPQIEVDFYDSLIRGIFRFVGADQDLYPDCFEACKKLCWDKEVLHANDWLNWSGYFEMAWSMHRAVILTERTNLLHCPPAPMLVVAIAMRQVILHGKLTPNDQIIEFLRRFDCNRKAVTAIHCFREHSDEVVLTLNQPWNTSLDVHQQPQPNSEIEQAAQANSTPPSSTVAVDLGRGNSTASPRADHSRQSGVRSPEEATRAALPITLPLRVTTPQPFVTPAPRPFKARSAFIMSPDSPAVSSSVRARLSPSLFVTPLPFRLAATPAAATPAARRVRSPPPPPTPLPVPIFSSPLAPTPVSVQPRPTPVGETTKRVTRAEVMVQVQPLVDRLKREGWNGNIQVDIMQVLNDKNVRVLPYFAKQTLHIWAEASRKHTVVGWLEQARDDVDVFEWVERDAEPELEPEPVPQPEPEAEQEAEDEVEGEGEPGATLKTSSSAPSSLDVFHDLEAGIASISDTTTREQLLANLQSLKANLYTSDLAEREEMHRRIDQHDQIIRVLQAQMSDTQQTAVGAVIKPAVAEKKVAPSVAERVVIVIESDGEAPEDQQREKKKKKKKKKTAEREREETGAQERKKRKRKLRLAKEEESDAEVVDSEEERRAKRDAKKGRK